MMFDMGYEQTDSLFGFNDTGSDCEVMSYSPLPQVFIINMMSVDSVVRKILSGSELGSQ